MRNLTEELAQAREAALLDKVRAVVREEIAKAFGALARESAYLDYPYETAELDSRALSNIKEAAEGTVKRLTCPHEEYSTWHDVPKCARCGEPEPEPRNPFETNEDETNATS